MFLRSLKFHNIYRWIVSCLYPNVCPCCDRIIGYNDAFCAECSDEIKLYESDYSIPYFDKFTAYCEYERDKPSGISVLKFKKECEGNAYFAFAAGIYEALKNKELDRSIDAVAAVPVTENVLNHRGYNQAELIAEELKYMLNVPYIKALEKIRPTVQQKTLGINERKKNVSGAFALRNGITVKDKCILVVDDVCTTGSTLSEAAKILKENGADSVITAAFAKTVKHDDYMPEGE